ncbi:MAG: glycerophosphodiester phosphodiesterase family protein [Pseudomonadota bacterium]|nr:glycerophosphodiester phosphodiesterase family protein [Pseudomonadota bacterium]
MAERFSILDFAYAHRGLWSDGGPPENSLEAILAAAEAGLGCELDVRPAACGTPVVFHDPFLDRMTGASGIVANLPAHDLENIDLKGRGTLPTLEAVLDRWPCETPLLVELKIDGHTDAARFTRDVCKLVDSHAGPAAIMSFSRAAVAAVPPALMKGALILPTAVSTKQTLEQRIDSVLDLSPDYLACHVTDAEKAVVIGAEHGLPVAIWTIASQAICESMAALPVARIFEGFDPAFARP